MNALALAPQHDDAAPAQPTRALTLVPQTTAYTAWAPAEASAPAEVRFGIASLLGGLGAIVAAAAAMPLLFG